MPGDALILDDCEVVVGVVDLGTLCIIETVDASDVHLATFLEWPQAQRLASMIQAKLDARAAQGAE